MNAHIHLFPGYDWKVFGSFMRIFITQHCNDIILLSQALAHPGFFCRTLSMHEQINCSRDAFRLCRLTTTSAAAATAAAAMTTMNISSSMPKSCASHWKKSFHDANTPSDTVTNLRCEENRMHKICYNVFYNEKYFRWFCFTALKFFHFGTKFFFCSRSF